MLPGCRCDGHGAETSTDVPSGAEAESFLVELSGCFRMGLQLLGSLLCPNLESGVVSTETELQSST